MSKAFTKEDAPVPGDGDALPPRERDLPITRAGLARLRAELAELSAAHASEPGARRARVLQPTRGRIQGVGELPCGQARGSVGGHQAR